jgi:hypothetical protein
MSTRIYNVFKINLNKGGRGMNENKVGRPLKFKSASELQQKIDEYFESCHEEIWTQVPVKDGKKIIDYKWVPVLDRHGNVETRQVKPFTITGLAVHLDTSRRTLIDYEDKDGYSHTIKKAKDKIESFTEEALFTNKNTAGVIFNMVNNYGWKNKQEHEQNITMNQKLEDFFK